MDDPDEVRRPLRFGLRWLLGLMLAVCILFGWMAHELKIARDRQALVRADSAGRRPRGRRSAGGEIAWRQAAVGAGAADVRPGIRRQYHQHRVGG